jgi:hypothetical protein
MLHDAEPNVTAAMSATEERMELAQASLRIAVRSVYGDEWPAGGVQTGAGIVPM